MECPRAAGRLAVGSSGDGFLEDFSVSGFFTNFFRLKKRSLEERYRMALMTVHAVMYRVGTEHIKRRQLTLVIS